MDFDGGYNDISVGGVIGIAVAAFAILVILPILCCCFCCGWCCFRGRNKNTQNVQIFQPPPTSPTPPIPPPKPVAAERQILSHVDERTTNWNNYPQMNSGQWNGQGQQSHINHGYVGQPQPPYYPEPRYNYNYSQQQQQYPHYGDYGQGYHYNPQEHRIPRNHLGQSTYDIYEPKRPISNPPRPRPKM